MKLYYIRHGQTDWNAEFRFQGQRDIPLNATGRKQASRNGKTLARLLAGEDLETFRFVASPLSRACETMERVRTALNLPPKDYETDERLVEASYGEWEGISLPEVKKQFYEQHRARKADRWGFVPPGGESHEMVAARIKPVLSELDLPTVMVAHGMVGRVVRQILLGLDKGQAGDLAFPQDKVCVFDQGHETFV